MVNGELRLRSEDALLAFRRLRRSRVTEYKLARACLGISWAAWISDHTCGFGELVVYHGSCLLNSFGAYWGFRQIYVVNILWCEYEAKCLLASHSESLDPSQLACHLETIHITNSLSFKTVAFGSRGVCLQSNLENYKVHNLGNYRGDGMPNLS